MNMLKRDNPLLYPVKAVQFGEGNFLRAFIDWMIQRMNQKADFCSSVQIIQPRGKGKDIPINEQDGLYTLVLRGSSNGVPVQKSERIDCVKGCWNTIEHWEDIKQLFRTDDLRFFFSNTTESGIEYIPEEYTPDTAQKTFPAKVASLLYDRYQSGKRGLIFLPCELIEANGDTLRKYILQYAEEWNLEKGFSVYVEKECVFCNTLVDRIVSGYPAAEADKICEQLGYTDKLLDCAEPFHSFVIEGADSVKDELPFEKAGLNVSFVSDVTQYRTRKVRFLNGAHTSSVLGAYLAGFDYVDEMVRDDLFNEYVKKVLFDEVYCTVDLPDSEKQMFASAVLERFANPYAMHKLLSISLNSVSKWKVRVLPSVKDYLRINGKLPNILVFSLAALIAFYRNTNGKGLGRVNGYPVSDSPEVLKFFENQWIEDADSISSLVNNVLKKEDFWGEDLSKLANMQELVSDDLTKIINSGVRSAVRELIKNE